MAEFPSREGEIIALALKLIQGLTENPDVFQSPVISPEELTATLERFQDAEEEAAKEGESGPAAFGSRRSALSPDAITTRIRWLQEDCCTRGAWSRET